MWGQRCCSLRWINRRRAGTLSQTCHAHLDQHATVCRCHYCRIFVSQNRKKVFTWNGSSYHIYWNVNGGYWVYEPTTYVDFDRAYFLHGLFRTYSWACCMDLSAWSCTAENIVVCHSSKLGIVLLGHATLPNNQINASLKEPSPNVYIFCNLELSCILF